MTFYPAVFVPNALCENNHKFNRKKILLILRLNTSIIQSKRIGDYSYVGENCMILQGVTIGKCCLVGGGSVVTKSVPDGCMVAGNPARFIGYTDAFYKRVKETNNVHCFRMSAAKKKEYLLSLPDSAFPEKPFIRIQE